MLIIISGPSGVGKGTLIDDILNRYPNIPLSTSATTRYARPGEMDGLDYYFISDEEFDNHIKNNNFLEWCDVHTNRYGTLKQDVTNKLKNAPAVIVEIDVQGAAKIRQHKDVIQHHIFIAPPSIHVLEDRLRQRNTETNERIEKRLKVAFDEMAEKDLYDTTIVNNKLTQSINELNNVILSILTKGVTQ